MINHISIEWGRYLPGASNNLPQKTARVKLFVKGDFAAWRNHCILTSEDISIAVARLLPTQMVSAIGGLHPAQKVSASLAPVLAFSEAVLALCIGLQREARDAVWLGDLLGSRQTENAYEIILALPYERDTVLSHSLGWAVRFWSLWGRADAGEVQRDKLDNDCRAWLEKVQVGGLPPNTFRFALAAYARFWPVHVEESLLHIGWGAHRQTLDSSFTGQTSLLGTRTARDKSKTRDRLRQAGLPVPLGGRVADLDSALSLASKLGWPVVVKPSNQDQGTAVVPGIKDEETLRMAFENAAKYSPRAVIVEKHISGDDHRLLVVHGRMLMATHRVPGGVVGDGCSSVAQLIEQVNSDPRRGTNKRSLLIQLSMNSEALACLKEQGLSADSIPESAQFVRLRRTANISTGGTAKDVTTVIHPDNRVLAERAARVIGLDIAGVDFLCPDITRSWHDVGGAICEVNAQPGFRPHWLGDPHRDINGDILDLLFARHSPRIPTAAVTGTNGKTTTARMLHHVWQTAGKVAGVCTTQGVWIGNDCVTKENISGFPGARLLLADPMVEAAVLEMPRKGLIRFGHPCDWYDVAGLLNVQDDHIGVDGVETLEAMAKLKAEILRRASRAIVVNADDKLCLEMRKHAATERHVLVARSSGNAAVAAHREVGGEAVFVTMHEGREWIVLSTGADEIRLMPLHNIPATMNGLLKFNEKNALFAIAIAWSQNLPLATIRQAMEAFHNSPGQNPGRYNFIEGLPFQVLLDYGHNPDGVKELFNIASQIPTSGKRLLISVIGNRFRHHLETQIPWIVQTFDDIFLSQDEAYFQKNAHGFDGSDPLGGLLSLAKALIEPKLRDGQLFTCGRKHLDILAHGVASARPGDLLVILAEPGDVLPIIEKHRKFLAAKEYEA